jgi:hypothetical protein
MGSYKVEEGDHLSGIAQKFGFRDFNTIWNDASNEKLKTLRKDPHILMPGDVVNIPDRQDKKYPAPTGKTHVFKIPGKPLMLRIVIRDFDNEPMPNLPCELQVDGKQLQLTSDDKGMIQAKVSPTTVSGLLKIPQFDLEMPLQIGFLDPFDEDPGWQARLINLGYYVPTAGEEPDRLKWSIEEFQCDNGLKVTGEMDAATKNKLKEQHGS